MTDWTEKIAVITGAASGIGMGLAQHCLHRGMQVVAADVDRESLARLERASGVAADRLQTVVVDVSKEADVESLADRVFSHYGKVNLLFNNAGVLVDGKSWERPIRDWRWIIDVNVMGVIHGIRHFVPRMLAQGASGRVINTSSVGGLLGGAPFMAPYNGTKHMVTSITESLYQELLQEPAPVTASVLCPAEVATGIWESDRLRPAEQRNVLASEAERQNHELIAGGVARGLAPEDFAQRVFAAIEADSFWLIPQQQTLPFIQIRTDSILNGTNPRPAEELIHQWAE